MRKCLFFVASLALFGACEVQTTAQQQPKGTAESIGEKIDKGLDRLGTEIKQGWAEAKKNVENLSVEGRVYARLHWDKELAGAPIEIETHDQGVVVLKGSVPSPTAKAKAVRVTNDTMGVNRVVDELTVAPAST